VKSLYKLLLVWLFALSAVSCGGGGDVASGGGTGFGGTGLTFVKGNVVSVNGQSISNLESEKQGSGSILIANLILQISHAQSFDPGHVTVTGGGKSTSVNQSGAFQLTGVDPSDNFVLTFSLAGGGNASLPLGAVLQGTIVSVKNVSIDTAKGKVTSDGVVSEPSPTKISGDADEDSNDENSEDDDDQSSEDETSEDDVSEDSVSEEEEDDDSEESGGS
jgi:hypothetical protein